MRYAAILGYIIYTTIYYSVLLCNSMHIILNINTISISILYYFCVRVLKFIYIYITDNCVHKVIFKRKEKKVVVC